MSLLTQPFSRRVRGMLGLSLVFGTMLVAGCGPTEQKEVPPAEKEEMRQQLKEMSNREQGGK